MSSWIFQNLQKRLLLYAVQQISVLSTVDLGNLYVSLGSSSQFSFDDLDLAVNEINIPQVIVESGTISHLDLQLTVSGGVSVKGNGLVFVIRPNLDEQKDDPSAFSLTKSIQNLTNSIMQIPEAATDLRAEADASSGGVANSSGSISSSGEESEAVPNVGTLDNMKNKLLNVALSKLTMSFEDLKIRIIVDDDTALELSLGGLEYQSGKNDLRKVTLRDFSVHHVRSKGEEQQFSNDMESLSNSVTYTQKEAASLYMSAMESLQIETPGGDEKAEETLSSKELVTLDHVDLSFQGLSSIEDLSLKDIKVNSRQVDIRLHNILALQDSVWDMVVRSMIHLKWSSDPQTSSLAGYRRFQKEQSLSDKLQALSIELERLNVHFSEKRFFSLKQITFATQQGEHKVFQVNAIQLMGDGLISETTKSPILRGLYKNDEASIDLLETISIKLSLSALEELSGLLQCGQDIANYMSKKTLKRHTKRVASNEQKFRFTAKPVIFTLMLEDYEICLKTEAIFSDLVPTLFKTNSITIERFSNTTNDTILHCQGVSVVTSRSRVQLNSYTESLDQSLLTSKFVCEIDHVTFEETQEKLMHLITDMEKIGGLFKRRQHEDRENTKKHQMKRSVRILQSSNIMYKNTELALFALVVNKVKVEVSHILNNKFGSLSLSVNSVMSAITEDGSLNAFCKGIRCNRVTADVNENVIEPIKLSDLDLPSIYLSKRTSGRLKVTVRNLAFTYYARWLDLLRTTKSKKSQSKFKDSRSEEQLELKIIDSSVILRPYRLNAALALVVDQLVCSSKSPFVHVRSVLKSGSLLLIDDFSNIKAVEDRHWPSLSAFYTRQGFSAIGRYEVVNVKVNTSEPATSLKIKCQNIVASLCADSAHTLTQVCIDLKYPLTFPDDQKYNYGRDQVVNTFKDVDLNFFGSSHIQEEFESNSRADEELIHIDPDWDTTEPSDSLSDSTNQPVNVQEAYLDVVQELRTSAPHENPRPVDINLEFEVDSITIKLFDGYDWKFTRRSISQTIERVDQQMKASHDEPAPTNQMAMTVFDSIYVSANASDTVDLQKRVNDEIQGEVKSPVYVRKANLHPSRHYKAAIQLEKLRLAFTGYSVNDDPSNTDTSAEQVNGVAFTTQRIEIIDNVPTSTWKKFLTLLRHEQWPLDRPMIRLDLTTYRPISCLMATELALAVEVAPLRLHIDQDALDFLVKFGEFKDSRFELIDEYPEIPFIQKLTTNSVKLKLDYKPKKVDYSGLRSGHASELMNFFILDGSNITLKGIALYGINGFTELNGALKAVWTPDITSRQIPGVLEGFAPIKSILALGSGVKALVGGSPPRQTYEEQRMKGGLRKGCNVFVRTTTGDFVRLGAKLASGTQTVLENAEQMLGGDGSNGRMYKFNEPPLDMNSLLEEDQLVGGSNPRVKGHRPAALVIDPSAGDEGEPKIVSLYADQPLDLHMGLEEAYHSLEKHMHVVYDVVWKTKGELRERDAGAAAAAVSVAKVAPVAIIRPLIGATEAVAKALQGISNHFDKDQINDINDKYKSVKPRK